MSGEVHEAIELKIASSELCASGIVLNFTFIPRPLSSQGLVASAQKFF